MIINKLKPFVTSFSEVISTFEHGREVMVGGEIKSVLVMNDFLSPEPDPTLELADIGDLGVYLTLDDGIGLNNLVVPTLEYERFKEEHGSFPSVGMIVLAKGKVMKFQMQQKRDGIVHTFSTHPEKTTRIVVLKLGFVPEIK